MFDILIKNGKIVDGSSQPAYIGDIGIKDGRITAMGDLADTEASQIIDATALTVTPGFIDIHTHSDFSPFADPRAESQIRQGVTTEVIGQCGVSLAPCTDETRKGLFGTLGIPDLGSWNSFAEMLETMEQLRNATNTVSMVGHGALRGMAMGLNAPRPATDNEVAEMVRQMEKSLEEGAFGFTTGLEYHPGKMSTHDEIVAICKPVAEAGGFYATHARNRDTRYFTGFGEAIDAARESGVRLQISHINPKYGRPGHTMRNTIQMIDWAREEGLDVSMDVMPTNWAHTGAIALLPAWSYELDKPAFLDLINTTEGRNRLKVNTLPTWKLAVEERWDKIRLLDVPGGSPDIGRTIEDLARERNTTCWDTIFDLMLEVGEAYSGIFLTGHAFAEEDIRLVMQHPMCSVESDTMALANDGATKGKQLGLYGYNWAARFISHYLRDEKVLSLEEGIRRITSLPASQIGLKDRGRLAPGTCADIAIFDLDQVKDNTSFSNPTIYAGGFKHVIVNGIAALNNGERTPDHAGKVLRRP